MTRIRPAGISAATASSTYDPLSGFGADLLTVGQETVHRRTALTSSTLPSGILRLSYFTARKSETVSQFRLLSVGAAGATPTVVRAGLFSVAANGDLTRVGVIANDTTIFAAASTAYTRTLTAPVAVTQGSRYAFGVLVVSGAATPTTAAQGFVVPSSEVSMAPRLAAIVTGQADMPSSVLAASLADTTAGIYAVLLP